MSLFVAIFMASSSIVSLDTCDFCKYKTSQPECLKSSPLREPVKQLKLVFLDVAKHHPGKQKSTNVRHRSLNSSHSLQHTTLMALRGGNAEEPLIRETAADLDDDCGVVGDGEDDMNPIHKEISEDNESTSSGFAIPGCDRDPTAPPQTIEDLLNECDKLQQESDSTPKSQDSTWPSIQVTRDASRARHPASTSAAPALDDSPPHAAAQTR